MTASGEKIAVAAVGKKKILVVVGTRPEAIKMAPVIKELQRAEWAQVRVLATAQHREMLDQTLHVFGIVPDIDLDIMRPEQGLPELTSRLLLTLDQVLASEAPDVVLAQGDTTTVMTVALASFYRKIPVGHVEAGLRSGDMYSPFPEEVNRIIADRLSRWHFAPTVAARENLLGEGIAPEHVYVTGNTVIDALLETASRSDLPQALQVPSNTRVILVTAHRRENFGRPLDEIFRAIRDLADSRADVHFVYPAHPNPNAREVACRVLGGHARITICDPMDYLSFVASMKGAYLILTDSGGVQEEAPALGKPVLVTRRETERPEAVAAGVAKLVGSDYRAITEGIGRLLDDPMAYAAMAVGASPYGDGLAARRIVSALESDLFVAGEAACSPENLPTSLAGGR